MQVKYMSLFRKEGAAFFLASFTSDRHKKSLFDRPTKVEIELFSLKSEHLMKRFPLHYSFANL